MKLKKRVRKMWGRVSGNSRKKSYSASPVTHEISESSASAPPHAFSQEILDTHILPAKRHGVEPHIHPQDFMYWYTVDYAAPANAHAAAAINYFDGGAEHAHKIVGIAEMPALAKKKIRLLEFASGYGRLSRHLKKYSNLDLVCSDIHQEAIEFLSNSLGVRAFVSHSQPAAFLHEGKYDVTFVLSLFTHLPKLTFGHWLTKLYETVNPGGRLIFTTHGVSHLASAPGLELPSDGFYFSAGSEQKDLNPSEYGVTITRPDYVFAAIRECTASNNIFFEQEGFGTQDLWIVYRT
jgi:SAM-dependent methyltransferase